MFRHLLFPHVSWFERLSGCIYELCHMRERNLNAATLKYGTTRVSQYQKGKTNLDFTEARDSEWQCKSAPRSRQITTPAPHRSVFYRPDALPAAQQTASKHWKQAGEIIHLLKNCCLHLAPPFWTIFCTVCHWSDSINLIILCVTPMPRQAVTGWGVVLFWLLAVYS